MTSPDNDPQTIIPGQKTRYNHRGIYCLREGFLSWIDLSGVYVWDVYCLGMSVRAGETDC